MTDILKKYKGFALSEMSVVLLILGVISGLCIPVYSQSMENAKAQDAINRLYFIYRVEKKAFQETGTYVSLTGSTWVQYNEGYYNHPYAQKWLGGHPDYQFDFVGDDSGFTATASRIGGTREFTINETGVVTETGS